MLPLSRGETRVLRTLPVVVCVGLSVYVLALRIPELLYCSTVLRNLDITVVLAR